VSALPPQYNRREQKKKKMKNIIKIGNREHTKNKFELAQEKIVVRLQCTRSGEKGKGTCI
jgi:hypothetical protein